MNKQKGRTTITSCSSQSQFRWQVAIWGDGFRLRAFARRQSNLYIPVSPTSCRRSTEVEHPHDVSNQRLSPHRDGVCQSLDSFIITQNHLVTLWSTKWCVENLTILFSLLLLVSRLHRQPLHQPIVREMALHRTRLA